MATILQESRAGASDLSFLRSYKYGLSANAPKGCVLEDKEKAEVS